MSTRKTKSYIGVDLGGTNVRAGRVQAGRLNEYHKIPVRSRGTEKEVIEDLCSVIDEVIAPGVRGIGVGVPSLVDVQRGTVTDTVNIPTWKKVPLRRLLEKKYGVSVRIDNDANCFALGERMFGRGRRYDNFVGLVIGTGLGAGIISNGRLHSGVDCGAGEFGMTPYLDSILERYASGQFFSRHKQTGEAVAALADDGDSDALGMFREYGKHLASGIKLILYGLAPEMIVLGGSVSHSYRHFEKVLKAEIADFAYPTITKKLKIEVSKLKGAALLGAASLFED